MSEKGQPIRFYFNGIIAHSLIVASTIAQLRARDRPPCVDGWAAVLLTSR